MQPQLSPHLILPTLASRTGGPMPRSGDELDHRRLHLVWASDESLATEVPTLGTALVQHGLKEWLGSDGATRLHDVRGEACGREAVQRAMLQALRPVMDGCEAENAMPIVICSDLKLAEHWVSERVASEQSLVMAVGAPYRGPEAGGASKGCTMPFPLQLQPMPEAAATVWLGAPGKGLRFQVPLAHGLRVHACDVTRRSVQGHLTLAQARVHAVTPATLLAVLFIDDIGLRPGLAHGLPAELFAATLRWLQAQEPWTAVFLVSHERVTHADRPLAADLARQLGGAMLKHRGLRRGAWGQAPMKPADSSSAVPQHLP